MDTVVTVVTVFFGLILLQILLCGCTPYPRREEILSPEQQHDVLTGDSGDECMEGSFE